MKKLVKPKIKIGKYKKVYQGIIFDVLQAPVVLPSGRKTVFEMIKRDASVAILAINQKGELLLTREFRSRQNKYSWRVPAGRVDRGEKPKAAAERELREEVGWRAKKMTLFNFNDSSQTLNWPRYVYLATDLVWDPLVVEEGESIKLVPTKLAEAVKLVRRGEITNDFAYMILKLAMQKKII